MTSYPKAPFLGLHKLPNDEQPAGQAVYRNLHFLIVHTMLFERDLQLYDFCMLSFWHLEEESKKLKPPGDMPRELQIAERQQQLMDWRQIAARDGALNIFHFGMTAAGVRQALSMSPTLRAQVDHQALRKAIRDFEPAFPNNRKIRHAVAHAAEKGLTPDDISEHGVVGTFQSPTFDLKLAEPAIITGMMDGRKYSEGWEGEIFEYELSQASVAKLVATTHAIYSAFREPEF